MVDGLVLLTNPAGGAAGLTTTTQYKMTTHLPLKALIVLLAAILLVVLRAWVEAEKANAKAHHLYHKEPRLANRFPQPSTLRQFLITLFNINA